MPPWFYVVVSFVFGLGLLIARAYLRVRALSPAVYHDLSLTELEPFLRSWGAWLGDRGVILVRHWNAEPIVQFRKHVYKQRPSLLVFRYRNADESRRSFHVARAALDAAGVEYDLELTSRTRKPRALAVALDSGDVFMPAAAIKLITTVFQALGVDTGAGFFVWCEGRIATSPDRENVPLIPFIAARRAGFRVGLALGRVARAIGFRPR